jgi:hypothetical protein
MAEIGIAFDILSGIIELHEMLEPPVTSTHHIEYLEKEFCILPQDYFNLSEEILPQHYRVM